MAHLPSFDFKDRDIEPKKTDMYQDFVKKVNEFKPDVIFVDRTKHFALEASKTDIPLIIHLRGDHWAEIIMAKETLYKSGGRKIAINKWEEMGEECFNNSKLILPICNHLSNITKGRYSGKSVETMYQAINPENWFHKKGIELKHPCVGILQSATIWDKTKELLVLPKAVSYTHLRAHETREDRVWRLVG